MGPWRKRHLAFSTGRYHLELMLESFAGDIYLAGVQENNRRTEEIRQSLCFEIRPLPVQTHLEPFHPFPQVRFEAGPDSKAGTFGNGWESHMEAFQEVPWKREAYPYQESYGCNWNWSRGNAALVTDHLKDTVIENTFSDVL